MKYNNEWLAKQYEKGNAIKLLLFWGHQPSNDGSITKTCFSQWWIAPFEVEGHIYRTAEHWMMAGKARLFNDADILEKVLAVDTPARAKKLGRQVKGFEPEVWDREKFNLVVQGNLHKFSSNPDLRQFLLNTGERVIVEASRMDTIWGIGLSVTDPNAENPSKWRGKNLLGYALMEVRDLLNTK